MQSIRCLKAKMMLGLLIQFLLVMEFQVWGQEISFFALTGRLSSYGKRNIFDFSSCGLMVNFVSQNLMRLITTDGVST